MPIARITGQGLFAMALAVALLWGCLITEHVLLKSASEEQVRALNDIRHLQRSRRQYPVVAPNPPRFRRIPPRAA